MTEPLQPVASPSPEADAPAPVLLPRPRHSRWRVFVFGAILFLSGIITGGALTFVAIQYYFKKFPPPPEKRQEYIIDWMKTNLELDPEQVTVIQGITKKRLETMRQAQNRLREQLTSMRDEVANVLTPEQQTKWNQMWQERFSKIVAQQPVAGAGTAAGGGMGKKNPQRLTSQTLPTAQPQKPGM
ncbi:TPA: hypothetical protein DDW35_00965 [Candidatus Sumerlaeota bacterium]|jgi:hypothetical protein|nr:hypothetical protein [Candidatus Sumerlaeota bacterium]